ncbi:MULTISPECIES: hypothetical protein [unclassified Paenibacillus]|uniref:hypothetical protein n=1 Tax=unclassified Paenibacillus TaxID=185978 RepID=UPI00362C745D
MKTIIIPEHLHDVELIAPPQEIIDLTKSYGVNSVNFFDDERHSNSMRSYNDIFINTRGILGKLYFPTMEC